MAFSILRRKRKEHEIGLERGWQFYARPNTLEPVGCVFRIDKEGVRFPVTRLDVETEEGVEAGVKITQRTEAKVGVLARFLEIIDLSAKANVGQARVLEFEIQDPIRVLSTDVAIAAALKDFLGEFVGKKGNRYFVIRQTRSAKSMKFRLTAEQLAELGGEGKVSAGLKAGASLKLNRGGTCEINQPFPERLLVTFQPDGITRLKAGLAEEGAYGLTPTVETLEWREPGEDR